MAHFPIKKVQGIIHYVGVEELSRMGVLDRDYVKEKLRPWLYSHLNNLTAPIRVLNSGEAPTKTGWLCEWCSYLMKPECPDGLLHVAKKGYDIAELRAK